MKDKENVEQMHNCGSFHLLQSTVSTYNKTGLCSSQSSFWLHESIRSDSIFIKNIIDSKPLTLKNSTTVKKKGNKRLC